MSYILLPVPQAPCKIVIRVSFDLFFLVSIRRLFILDFNHRIAKKNRVVAAYSINFLLEV